MQIDKDGEDEVTHEQINQSNNNDNSSMKITILPPKSLSEMASPLEPVPFSLENNPGNLSTKSSKFANAANNNTTKISPEMTDKPEEPGASITPKNSYKY